MRFKSLASSSNCLELALEGFPRPLQTSMSSDGWSPFCCGCLCGSELVGDGVEELEGEVLVMEEEEGEGTLGAVTLDWPMTTVLKPLTGMIPIEEREEEWLVGVFA